MKLSVAIATFNEAKNIDRCLTSVKFADEIIISDEGSTDGTQSIVRKHKAKLIRFQRQEMFHANKQNAINHCTGDWILCIDADEEVTPELQREIKETLKNPDFNGYQIPRRNLIFGKWLAHSGWYPDHQVKLFRRGKGHYPLVSFHEMIKIDGGVGTLKADLLHYHYTSIDQFITRMNRYTTNDAEYILGKGETVVWQDAIRYPVDEFLKRYLFWEGYKDGFHGLVLALFQSASRLFVFAKIWEKQKYPSPEGDLLQEVISESKEISRKWHHWLIASESDPVKKLTSRLKTKLRQKLL